MSNKPSSEVTMWQPTIPIDQGIYDVSSTQKAPLGTRLEVGDKVFYYAQATAGSLASGTVLCPQAMKASHGGAILAVKATSAGVKVLTLTLGTSVAANEYAEGYVIFSTGAGNIGIPYRIKSHASYGTAATNCAITLYDDLAYAANATNEVDLVHPLYAKLAIGSSALDIPVGIAPVDVTTSNYFWLQTYGPGAPLNQAATPAAAVVKMGTTGGVLQAFNETTNDAGTVTGIVVGKNYGVAGTAGQMNAVFLTIRP